MAGLLVSVRDASEVAAALEGGASLIDVKEPANGALGRADDDVREAILDAVAGRVPVSAALGELVEREDHGHDSRRFVRRAPEQIDTTRLAYVKYGLNYVQMLGEDWRSLLGEMRAPLETGSCRLVFTAYADWDLAWSPMAADVVRFAIEQRAAVLLLDTWDKEGTLLDWMSVDEVADLSWQAWTAGVRVALAGSLGVEQIWALRVAMPDWFAVRGAACERGERGAAIDARRVRQLVEAAR